MPVMFLPPPYQFIPGLIILFYYPGATLRTGTKDLEQHMCMHTHTDLSLEDQ